MNAPVNIPLGQIPDSVNNCLALAGTNLVRLRWQFGPVRLDPRGSDGAKPKKKGGAKCSAFFLFSPV